MAVKKSAASRKANTSTGKAGTPVKKAAAKKPAAKKTAAKKTVAKKTEAKKAPAQKTAAKKTPAGKTAPKKSSSFVASPEVTDSGYSEENATFLSGNGSFYNRAVFITVSFPGSNSMTVFFTRQEIPRIRFLKDLTSCLLPHRILMSSILSELLH